MECRRLAWCGLVVSLVLLVTGCGGGGGGGTDSGSQPIGSGATSTPVPGTPTRTPTPLRVTSSRNERTESNDFGSITLRLQELDLLSGQSTIFSVFLLDANGNPVANQQLAFDSGLLVSLPDGDKTRADGSVTGSVASFYGGRFALTVGLADQGFNGLSVTLTVFVSGPIGSVPTPTAATGTPIALTPTPPPTQTATPLPCIDVETIIVQTDTPNISSQSGGTPKITAIVFDSNNLPVGNVNVLFDVQPRVGTFTPLVKATDSSGNTRGSAQSELQIPANSSFGLLNVTASACGKTGNVGINIVSGVSTKPVTTVVLQADPATVSSVTGGTINLTAAVLDADNAPINGIDALFITTIGKASPLIDRTKVSGAQGGIARSVLQVPVGAVNGPYVVSVLAGGVSGSTTITVIPDRVGPGGQTSDVPSGEPASITLGASPTRIQVAGTGGTELATVIGRVFDNNGNPLPGVRVHYHVIALQSSPGAVILPVTQPTPTGSPTPVPSTLCAPDDPFAVSDAAGFAVIQLRAGTAPGPVTVVACTDTIVKDVPSPLIETQAVVTVSSGPVNHIALTVNSRYVDNNDGSLLTTVSAIVTDAQGNVVEDGTPVFFEVLARRVCAGGGNDGAPCANNDACSGGACVDDPSDPSRNVAISSNSITNSVAPCDTSQFIVQTGLPISPQPGDAITCVKYPNTQQGSEVIVRASVSGVTNNINGQAIALPGHVGDLEVNITPPTVTVTGTSDGLAVIRAIVFNLNEDPVENVRVRFFTSFGTVDRSVLTNADGEAVATLTIPAGTASDTAKLRVSAGGIQITSIPVAVVNTGGAAPPTPGSSDQAAALHFIGAAPDTIGVRGSGLPSQSKLTFQAVDGVGLPVAGVPVTFSLAQIADENITPTQAVTDSNGNAQVTLTSGNRALSVQITAQVDTADGPFTVRSTPVTIFGGPPSQPNFSLAHQFHNISGRVTFGLTDVLTAFVGDRFGNPVPPGTAVSFTTKGGAVGNLSSTNALGQATATLVSQAPVADSGIVATLATTRGERPFIDHNGNGICDQGDDLLPVPEPYYDENCNGVHDGNEDFVDLNDDGVFNDDQGPGVRSCDDQIVVFESICTTFSAGTQVLLLPSGSGPLEAGGTRSYTLIVSDNPDPLGNPGVGNPLIGGSTVTVTVSGSRARVLGLSSFSLPDAQTVNRIIDGINRFSFAVTDNAPTSPTAETDAVVVSITSAGLPAGGNGSVAVQDFVTFLAAPIPTPTP
jgi:hypothetical protein